MFKASVFACAGLRGAALCLAAACTGPEAPVPAQAGMDASLAGDEQAESRPPLNVPSRSPDIGTASPIPPPPPKAAPAFDAGAAPAADIPNPQMALDDDAGAIAQPDRPSSPTAGALPCTPNAYVSNSFADSVSIIDTNTHTVIATVPTGSAPVNPVFTPDRRKVYVSNSQSNTLTVIDVETNEVTTIPAGGSNPSGLAFSPDGNRLYVSLIADFVSPGAVLSIDLTTGVASPPIPMGADPERIALTPDGARLYVNNLLDGTMAVIDTASAKVIATLNLGELPFNPLLSPDGTVVYVGVMSANHIAVIDTATNQVVRTIPADSPNGMTYSKDFESLFVSNALSGTVQQVSLTTNMILKTATVGGVPGNMAVLPDGKLAYMVRPDGSTVEILDTSTLAIVDSIEVENGPTVVTVCRPAATSPTGSGAD